MKCLNDSAAGSRTSLRLRARLGAVAVASSLLVSLGASADAIQPIPRPVKGAKEMPQAPTTVDTVPTGRADLQNQATRALKQAKVNSMRAGMSFLLQNKVAPGVKTLKSGVQYKVVTAGDGPKPQKGDTVEVAYTGRLVDGTTFSASEAGHPAAMRIPSVVPGLVQALQMMKTGSHWEIVIPPDLGYGDTGALPTIPPGAVLIYDLELIAIKGASAPTPSAEKPAETQGEPADPAAQ